MVDCVEGSNGEPKQRQTIKALVKVGHAQVMNNKSKDFSCWITRIVTGTFEYRKGTHNMYSATQLYITNLERLAMVCVCCDSVL